MSSGANYHFQAFIHICTAFNALDQSLVPLDRTFTQNPIFTYSTLKFISKHSSVVKKSRDSIPLVNFISHPSTRPIARN